MEKQRMSCYAVMDFSRMNDNFSSGRGYVYVLEDGKIRHELPDGYSLTFEGDGIVRVGYEYQVIKLESRAYDEHAYYARGFEGKAFPRRCLDLYKQEISVGHIKREDEK